MEYIDAIKEIVNSLGFPIAMVVYFIWDKTMVTNQLTQAIENNNTILTKLMTKLNIDDGVVHIE